MNLSSILKYPCRVSKFRSVLHSVERASLNAEPYFISRPVNTLPFRIILFRFKFLITGTDDIFLHRPPLGRRNHLRFHVAAVRQPDRFRAENDLYRIPRFHRKSGIMDIKIFI